MLTVSTGKRFSKLLGAPPHFQQPPPSIHFRFYPDFLPPEALPTTYIILSQHSHWLWVKNTDSREKLKIWICVQNVAPVAMVLTKHFMLSRGDSPPPDYTSDKHCLYTRVYIGIIYWGRWCIRCINGILRHVIREGGSSEAWSILLILISPNCVSDCRDK